MTNDGPPLCFAIASIFPDRLGERVGEPSDPVCMYRCSWEEDCNYYMEFDEDDFMDMEYDSCAGQTGLDLEPGCFDMGFCSDRNEAKEWKYYLWPYDADNEDEVEWMSMVWYWIPVVYTNPPGCQLVYRFREKKNVEWEWDTDMCDEEMIDMELCQSLKLTPALFEEDWDIFIKIAVEIQGSNVNRWYYQYFAWDWEMYNMMQEGGDDWGDEWECPSDVAGCDEMYYFEEYYYMPDWECPSDDSMCEMPEDFHCPPDDPDCEDWGNWSCPEDDPDCDAPSEWGEMPDDWECDCDPA